jgi:hypothetical protein
VVSLSGVALLLGFAGARAGRCWSQGTASKPPALIIDEPQTYWARNGFIPLTTPIHLPSNAAGTDQAVVWLKIPEGSKFRTRRLPGGGLTVAVPEGTVADRVETIDGSVADVRGTRFGAGGRQLFHILRPATDEASSRLVGYEWPRGDDAGKRAVTELMLMRARIRERNGARAADRFASLMDCAGCHAANKPESLVPAKSGVPNRATDDSGLYQILAVFADEAPLERYRSRDLNVDDPFVHIHCGDHGSPDVARGHDGSVSVSCPDGTVPIGRFDMAAALRAGDPRAREICRTRRALGERLDDAGQHEFTAALEACAASTDTMAQSERR